MRLPLFDLPPAAQRAWLIERLSQPAPPSALGLSDGFRLPGREGAPTPAAVHVLPTQRSAQLPDHAGQISFPGGRVEPQDPDHAAAALREATEEIGLDRERVEVLGELAQYETVTGYRVAPIVGWIEPPLSLTP